MLDICKVVLRLTWSQSRELKERSKPQTYISIQGQFPERLQRIIRMWPNFRHVEDIPTTNLSVFGVHHLEIACPCWIFLPLNGVKQVLEMMIRSSSCKFSCFLFRKGFDSLVSFDVDLDIFERPVLAPVSLNLSSSILLLSHGIFLTGFVNLYVEPLKPCILRSDAGVPRSLKRCISSCIPSWLLLWKL